MKFASLTEPTSRAVVLASGLAAASMLAVALVAQYVFSLFPCHLCLLQRYPYAIVVGLALFAWIRPPAAPVMRWLAVACFLLFLADAGIAFYHAGVEQGWFPGPSGCTNASAPGASLEDMRMELLNAPLVACDQAMAHVLGLSLAAWNTVFASAFALLSFLRLKQIHAFAR